METYYTALRRLLIPNGPGSVPSTVRVAPGEVFSLDGTEPVDVGALLRQGAIRPYEGEPPSETVPMKAKAKRSGRKDRQ